MSPLYIALLVVVVVSGIAGIILLLKSQGEQARKRQMSVITGRGALRDDTNDKSTKDKRRADLAKKLKDTAEPLKKEEKKQTIRDLMIYAGLTPTQSHFWIGSAVAGFVFILLAIIFAASPIIYIFAFLIGFFGIPRFVLKFMAGKRQKKFLEEFADALESMVRLLKAGMPVGEAIAMVAREFHGPVGEEMSRVYENQRIGVPLGEAVLEAAKRMPLAEVQMFATGIVIQQQTGSSLSDVLMNLAALIRARFRLRRKVQALSAEAKASAAIIGALPVVVSLGLYFINPDYIGLLFTTSSGKFYLTCAVCWMMVGMFIMRQMINFKV